MDAQEAVKQPGSSGTKRRWKIMDKNGRDEKQRLQDLAGPLLDPLPSSASASAARGFAAGFAAGVVALAVVVPARFLGCDGLVNCEVEYFVHAAHLLAAALGIGRVHLLRHGLALLSGDGV